MIGCCWPRVAQTTPLAALAIKIDHGIPDKRLLPDGGIYNAIVGPLFIKFGGGLPGGMLLGGSGTDKAVGGPCHQV